LSATGIQPHNIIPHYVFGPQWAVGYRELYDYERFVSPENRAGARFRPVR
jgi:hypothetical protein